MNILIIGNGFDLAHGLPTKYGDFLKFIAIFEKYKDICVPGKSIESEYNEAEDSEKEVLIYFSNLCEQKKTLFAEFADLTKNNVWIKYFNEIYESRQEEGKDGWIDFESEISTVIQALDSAKTTIIAQINEGEKTGKMTPYQFGILSKLMIADKKTNYETISFETKAIEYRKNKFLADLNRLIRCLEIYLSHYVEGMKDMQLLKDIQDLPFIDKVLSFNYTSTYEKLYDRYPCIEYDYIHGKANLENNMESNNMVLGIDEYLDDGRKDKEIDFIEFKKYYQRIHKETGCLYRNWIDEIKADKEIKEITTVSKDEEDRLVKTLILKDYHKLFIFGHSLDITDKDILKDFILNNKVQTVIFYTDKKDYGRKITNLVRIIGQDELIKRTGGASKTITFKMIQKSSNRSIL